MEPYRRKVNYYETDQMGIIHHANYVRYLEECRMYYMEQNGLEYTYVESLGILIPVLGVQIDYKQAIRYGDEIIIEEKFSKFSQVKFSITYEIRNAKTGELHATASSDHCFVNKALEPVRLKKDYPEIYNKFHDYVVEEQKHQ